MQSCIRIWLRVTRSPYVLKPIPFPLDELSRLFRWPLVKRRTRKDKGWTPPLGLSPVQGTGVSSRGGGVDTWVCVITSCPGDSSVPSPPCADSLSTWRRPPDPRFSGPQCISRFVVHKDRNGAAPPPALTVSPACRSVADRRSPQVLVRNLIHHSGLLRSLSTAGTAALTSPASGPAGGSSTSVSREDWSVWLLVFGGLGFCHEGFGCPLG